MLDLKEILSQKDDHRIGKTGYVALLGRPNTGKSTLLNTVLHRHLAAVSPKPQTTRKYLLGIHTDDSSQILFWTLQASILAKSPSTRRWMPPSAVS